MELRDYQREGARCLAARPDKRLLLHYATGAGKTATAINAARELGAKSVLVVAPALARPTWRREFDRWWPEAGAHSIRFGRTRKSLTKAQTAERDAAYAADVQIVSYELLPHLLPRTYDIVILDEIHNLGSPLSLQSRAVRALFKHHPPVAALGLTATLYRTEVKQLWCPLDTLWPGEFGKASQTGNISWSFLNRYTEKTTNEYGTAYHGSHNLPELQKRLDGRVHRVVESDFARFLPPLHAEIMYLDERRSHASIAGEWVSATDTERVGIFTYLHDSQAKLAEGVGLGKNDRPVYIVNGEQPVEARVKILQAAAEDPRGCILLATVESVREAISLSFLKAALVFEWRTSPASAVQFLGRFARADSASQLPTHVQYVCGPGDESRAETLQERINAANTLATADRKSATLAEIFAPRPMTEERLENLFTAMMATARVSLAEEDDDV